MMTELEMIKETDTSTLMAVLFFGARNDEFMAIVEELAERGVDLKDKAKKWVDEIDGWAEAEAGTFYSDVCDAVDELKAKEVQ
jgi:hypothetical protein